MTFKTGDTTPGSRRRLVGRDGEPADLTGATVVMQVRSRPGTSFPVTVDDATGGVIVVPRGDLDVQGTGSVQRWSVEYEVTFASGLVQTFPEQGYDTLEVWRDLDGV